MKTALPIGFLLSFQPILTLCPPPYPGVPKKPSELAEPMLTERFIMKNVSTLRPQALKAGFQFQWSFSLPMTMVVASSIQC
jgi:hypothetical protein